MRAQCRPCSFSICIKSIASHFYIQLIKITGTSSWWHVCLYHSIRDLILTSISDELFWSQSPLPTSSSIFLGLHRVVRVCSSFLTSLMFATSLLVPTWTFIVDHESSRAHALSLATITLVLVPCFSYYLVVTSIFLLATHVAYSSSLLESNVFCSSFQTQVFFLNSWFGLSYRRY